MDDPSTAGDGETDSRTDDAPQVFPMSDREVARAYAEAVKARSEDGCTCSDEDNDTTSDGDTVDEETYPTEQMLVEAGDDLRDDITERIKEMAGSDDEASPTEATESADSSLSTVERPATDTLTMEVTVDVSDFDERDRQILAALARGYEDSFLEVVEKNRDYSWSFLRTGEKLAASATPFDQPVRSQLFGLLTRTGDKRERLVENVFGNGSAAVSDDASTTAREAANYYQFIAFVLDNPELATENTEGSST